MLIRFIERGSVKAGPGTIHGFPGQVADLDGDDLAAAVEAKMVEIIEGAAAVPKPRARKKES